LGIVARDFREHFTRLVVLEGVQKGYGMIEVVCHGGSARCLKPDGSKLRLLLRQRPDRDKEDQPRVVTHGAAL